MTVDPERPRRRRPPPELRLGRRRVALPRSAWVRAPLGVLLVLGGVLGFLPILGFWMIPIGVAVLAVDIPAVDRLRRSAVVRWRAFRRRRRGGGG